MEQIGAALNDRDVAALKGMFSPYALGKAADIDAGLEYLLSFFPDGGVTWKLRTIGSEGQRSFGTRTDMLQAYYIVKAGGRQFTMFFADVTVNEGGSADRAGIYAMGVSPYTDTLDVGPAQLFFSWAGAMSVDEKFEMAYPGVYVPDYVDPRISTWVMEGIVEELDSGDDVGFEARFGDRARAAAGLKGGIDALLGMFPDGEVAWEALSDGPVIRQATSEGGGQAVLMLSTYPVSSGGKDFWVSFAYFPVNEADPSLEGIYAVGAAPRTAAGGSPQEQALFAWLDSFDVAGTTPPGIFLPE
ncbi:MAG: DUF5104 domain-containing protein [Micrococcales bacterium]|nr:DUF5104 domain-containing protein [Micrococcales bacterium]OJX69198.1 MAG: hypothetical protein BGO94_11635 [Micrococcales bacterium 72-143]